MHDNSGQHCCPLFFTAGKKWGDWGSGGIGGQGGQKVREELLWGLVAEDFAGHGVHVVCGKVAV